MSIHRIEELEMRFAQQERVIADLNDVITAQWKKIDGLEIQLRRLRDEVNQMDFGPKGQEPPPPHY